LSREFEQTLSKTLAREVVLPRDPQKVPTYAPNVYVYFVMPDEFCVVSHLYKPSEKSVEYTWEGGTFHSHTLTYGKNGN
jgi:hypothetical protein